LSHRRSPISEHDKIVALGLTADIRGCDGFYTDLDLCKIRRIRECPWFISPDLGMVRFRYEVYSCRSADIGYILAARRAGI
jgi:hypothetical protein